MAVGALPYDLAKSKLKAHHIPLPAVTVSTSPDANNELYTVLPVETIFNLNQEAVARLYDASQVFCTRAKYELLLAEFKLEGAGSLTIKVETSVTGVTWYTLPNWTDVTTTSDTLLRINNLQKEEFVKITVTYTGSNKYYVNILS